MLRKVLLMSSVAAFAAFPVWAQEQAPSAEPTPLPAPAEQVEPMAPADPSPPAPTSVPMPTSTSCPGAALRSAAGSTTIVATPSRTSGFGST